MAGTLRQPAHSRLVWLSLLIALPLLLAQIDILRDLYCDTAMIRSVALRSEMSQLRSQTIRRASRLETALELSMPAAGSATEIDWEQIVEEPWLANRWSALSAPLGKEYYLAVVDLRGVIVLHTNPAAIGKRVTSEWDDTKVLDAGNDVVRMGPGPLAGDKSALDVNVPLFAAESRVGRMHCGLDALALDRQVAAQQREYLWARGWIAALVSAANLAAVLGLVLLNRDFGRMRAQLAKAAQDQTRVLSQIGIGLAHELRNPLHALRMNVHTLRRSLGRASLSDQQVGQIMHESNDEIDRMDALVRDFVQFTAPQPAAVADVNLQEQVQATLHLLSEELRRNQIAVKTLFSTQPVTVRMSPDRLRHAALQLLSFAQRSAGTSGTIEVSITKAAASAELVIADNGPPVPEADRARLFEPFQVTAHSDGSLGLALIHRFITEAGGSLVRTSETGRNCFRLQLPIVQHSSQGTGP
jgi:signal transduction histidine kinase